MKKILVSMIIMTLLAPNAFAAKETKGASKQGLEHANENAVFNRVGDWFATVGKSKEENDRIKAERKAKRAQARAEKEAKRAQAKAEKEAALLEKKAQKSYNASNKQLKERLNKTDKKMHKGTGKKGS